MVTKKKAPTKDCRLTHEVRENIDAGFIAGDAKQISKNISNFAKLYDIKNPKVVLVQDDKTGYIEQVLIVGTRKLNVEKIKGE